MPVSIITCAYVFQISIIKIAYYNTLPQYISENLCCNVFITVHKKLTTLGQEPHVKTLNKAFLSKKTAHSSSKSCGKPSAFKLSNEVYLLIFNICVSYWTLCISLNLILLQDDAGAQRCTNMTGRWFKCIPNFGFPFSETYSSF